jgi:hypothetical protein
MILSSPAFAQDPASVYGAPVAQFAQDGVEIGIHEVGDMKVVAVSTSNPRRCLFLSYVKSNGEFSESEVAGFLEQFSSVSKVGWRVVDRKLVDNNLRFFLTAPVHAKEEFEKRVAQAQGDPDSVRSTWRELAASEEAHREGAQLLSTMESQRQIWISGDGRLLVCWSGDGKSLGVGIVPIFGRGSNGFDMGAGDQ